MTLKRILLAAAVLVACYALMPNTAAANPPDAEFEGMDADRDGMITATEHADAAARMFKTMDGNADGRISPGELASARVRMSTPTS